METRTIVAIGAVFVLLGAGYALAGVINGGSWNGNYGWGYGPGYGMMGGYGMGPGMMGGYGGYGYGGYGPGYGPWRNWTAPSK